MAIEDDKAPPKPPLGEESPPDNPLDPLQRRGELVTTFLAMLHPSDTDSVLQQKGEGQNLKVYRELLRDDQVGAAWQQRRLALTGCDTVVEPGADDALSKAAAEELDAQIKAMPWDDITDKMLYALYYGWGVAEVMWKPGTRPGVSVEFDRIIVRDRARFRFDYNRELFLWSAGGWCRMPERKFWTAVAGADHHDAPYGVGLAHSLYWPVFFKRNDIKFWLVFLEKFGMPTAIAKVPGGSILDPKVRAEAVKVLRNIATDAGVVIPDGIVVELLEAARSGAADYGAMHAAMNAAISKIIVGQTMTTDNGSSRSQAEVHQSVAEAITQADSDLLCGSFNAGPVKWWVEWNFPGATPPRVYRHTEPPEDLNARADRDGKIKSLGYSPTEEYILQTYGEGWEKSPDPVSLVAGAIGGRPGQPGNDPAAGGAEFAEGDPAALAALRQLRRSDQDALFRAARKFASDHASVTGQRVAQLLAFAEADNDPETFRRHLNELLEEAPPANALEKLTRAVMSSRLLGAIRAQRQR